MKYHSLATGQPQKLLKIVSNFCNNITAFSWVINTNSIKFIVVVIKGKKVLLTFFVKFAL